MSAGESGEQAAGVTEGEHLAESRFNLWQRLPSKLSADPIPLPDDEVLIEEMWINAFTLIHPTPEQLESIGAIVVGFLNQSRQHVWPGVGKAIVLRVVSS